MEVYKSIFNLNSTYNNFELYTENFDEFSFTELKDEVEEVHSITDFTPYHLQHETRTCITEAYRKLRLEKSNTGGYIILLIGYARSPFRNFESYLRIVTGLDKDEIQLISKH